MLLLSEQERRCLAGLIGKDVAFSVHKVRPYPGAVTVSVGGKAVLRLAARSVDIARKFEVFPMSVEPDPLALRYHDGSTDPYSFGRVEKIAILRTTNWLEPASADDQRGLFGDTGGATSQSEGRSADAPEDARDQACFDAGVYLISTGGKEYAVATSIFPFSLYVSDCDFSEPLDLGIYDKVPL